MSYNPENEEWWKTEIRERGEATDINTYVCSLNVLPGNSRITNEKFNKEMEKSGLSSEDLFIKLWAEWENK